MWFQLDFGSVSKDVAVQAEGERIFAYGQGEMKYKERLIAGFSDIPFLFEELQQTLCCPTINVNC